MLKFKTTMGGNVLMLRLDRIVAVKAGTGTGSLADTVTTIYCLR